jgi:hypothetical protein
MARGSARRRDGRWRRVGALEAQADRRVRIIGQSDSQRRESWPKDTPAGDVDPDAITARTGITPTSIHRTGEPLTASDKRVVKRSSWNLEIEHQPAIDVTALAGALCDRFPPAAAAACHRDTDVRVRFTFMIQRLRGGMCFDREALARLAALGAPLACYFYNTGA